VLTLSLLIGDLAGLLWENSSWNWTVCV